MIEHIFTVAKAAEEAAHVEANTGLLGTFGVNWKFFVAQLINFSIVIFILWKWVLTPVANKLTERTEKIDIALKDAEKIQAEKKEFDQWKQEEITKTRKEASEILHSAKDEAEKLKTEILQKTKQEQEKLIQQAKAQIASDQEKSMAEIKSEVADLVTTATEKVLKEKLDSTKDKKLIQDSINSI